MSVYASTLGTLWLTLESYGVDPCTVIDAAHFRPGKSSSSTQRISFEDFDAALEHAEALVGDPAIGIRIAQYASPSHYGALGYAWMASYSLRNALRRLQRFRHMYNESADFWVTEETDRVVITLGATRQSRAPNLLGDGEVASILHWSRLIYGQDLMPIDVTLKRPEPANLAPWFEYFGPCVQFGQEEFSLAISASDADWPLTGANRELVVMHEEIIQRHLVKLNRDNILNRARLGIMEHLPEGRVTENDLAQILNMSKRTLHRKLRENDETFRSLLTEVRRDLAEHYIHNANYSMTDISFLLGYADSCVFSRAFRKWFGRSPTQERERTQAD